MRLLTLLQIRLGLWLVRKAMERMERMERRVQRACG